jgi:hypothetical protein
VCWTRVTPSCVSGERLHFARLVILDDATLTDLKAHGLPVPHLPTYLAFAGDCDGPSRVFSRTSRAAPATGAKDLRALRGLRGQGDLRRLLARDGPAAATYVNWVSARCSR